MQSAPQNLLKEYVASQNFTSTADIMEAMKTMFRDVIEQVMEAEIDEELGRTRCQRTSEEGMPRNYRNGYTKKTVKTQLGKVREDHHYVIKAAYVVLGITLEGQKDILGIWIGEHESSKFWLNVLNDLKSRGIMDVYLFCTDGLCGMMKDTFL